MNKQEAQEKAIGMLKEKFGGIGIVARFGIDWRAHTHSERKYLETFYDLFSADEIWTIRNMENADWECYKDDANNVFPNYANETGASGEMATRLEALMKTIRDIK